jgi:ubiquinone/menaquinone biosynthesis C-methylase UbiE
VYAKYAIAGYAGTMTQHTHTHGHPDAGHNHHHGDGLADMLDLDAQVLGDYLDSVTAWAAGMSPSPATIVDVGAGTGVGTVALAARFPDAEIIAVDKSAVMLARTLEASQRPGVEGRVCTLEADLDMAWPAISGADLIWASSSLHELAAPEQAMRHMYAALKPGGLLLVVEMDGLPRFLSDDFHGGLESRLHAALDRQGWNSHPDWQAGLERAGFAAVERRAFPSLAQPTPELASRFARTFLGRVGPALEGIAAPSDLEALRELLDDDSPESVLNRGGLEIRGSRTAWAAIKP